jgi:hypothetical protein
MKVIEVESWDEFEKRLQEARQIEVSVGRAADYLFRGMGDSTWELATTLERAGREGIGIGDYYVLISRLKPQIESFTGRKWEIRAWLEVTQSLEHYDSWANESFPTKAEYSYMVHLRHHGFPSPLLDWSRSPYIAAFFAFWSPVKPHEDKVSIYAYQEKLATGSKITANFGSWIRRGGALVSAHRRHFLQQSDYTMCAEYRNVGDGFSKWCFANHDAVFQRGSLFQDSLCKFNVPWAERLHVLRLLDEYNLNVHSLFESEESLMETLAVRALEFH